MGRKPRRAGAIHVVTNRRQGKHREYVTHLLRRSWREGGRVKNETVGNISHLPEEVVELVRAGLKGQRFVSFDERFRIERSLPAGHVEAALAMSGRLGLSRLLDRSPARERALCLAMIVERVIGPGSKLAMTRAFAQSTLASELDIEGADEDELYDALDWLLQRQQRIERALARRHLTAGTLVLYDVSSSYFEGRSCPLAKLGYSRDRKPGTPQIVYGLLCAPDGCPVAVDVFAGSLHDDTTLPTQIDELKERFGLSAVIVVSDRGMVTKANLELLRETEGAAWITALKAPQVKKLVKDGDLQLSLFDEHNLAEIAADDYPDERLVVCRNPLVADDRARKREELLEATEHALRAVASRVAQGTLAGEAEIGLAVGAVWNRWRVKKHFELEIADTSLRFARKQQQIDQEAALDGIYVLRTSAPEAELQAPEVVRAYKQLKEVERGFRTLKGPLELRPIHHRLEDRVRSHVFLCMLAYYLTWHLRRALGPLLFDDEQPPERPDPVAKASRSPRRSARPRPSAPRRASPATRSRRCSRSSPPAAATRSACPPPAPPSTSSHSRPRPRRERLR